MSASINTLSTQRPPGESTDEPPTSTSSQPSAGPIPVGPANSAAGHPPDGPPSTQNVEMHDANMQAGVLDEGHSNARATGPHPPAAPRGATATSPLQGTAKSYLAAATARDRSTSPASVIAKASIFCSSGFEHVHHVLDATIQQALAGSATTIECRCTRDGDVLISASVAHAPGIDRPPAASRAFAASDHAPALGAASSLPPRPSCADQGAGQGASPPQPPSAQARGLPSPAPLAETPVGFAAPLRFKLVSMGGRVRDLLRDAATGHKTADIRPSTHRMGSPAGPPLAAATVGQILHGQSARSRLDLEVCGEVARTGLGPEAAQQYCLDHGLVAIPPHFISADTPRDHLVKDSRGIMQFTPAAAAAFLRDAFGDAMDADLKHSV